MPHQHSVGMENKWEAWKSYPDVTDAFCDIAQTPFIEINLHSTNFKLLERFVVTLYYKINELYRLMQPGKISLDKKTVPNESKKYTRLKSHNTASIASVLTLFDMGFS